VSVQRASRVPRRFAAEDDVRQALLRALSGRQLDAAIEVPFLGRSLDVVYRCTDGSITVVEVKLGPRHIRTAIGQAEISLLGADRVYVCVPYYGMTDKVRSTFRERGVGLMFLVSQNDVPSVRYEIPAGSNPYKQSEYAERLRGAFRALPRGAS
jgi:hypothetical protein